MMNLGADGLAIPGNSKPTYWACCVTVAAAFACLLAAPARAGVDDSRFFVSPDGNSVDFELRDVPRREVIERLFAGQPIRFDWVNREVAQETISGTFSGLRSDVIRQLLQQTNFILTYTGTGASRQVARVLVLGKASEGKAVAGGSTTSLAQNFPTAPAHQPSVRSGAVDAKAPAGGGAPMPMPGKTADLKPIPRAGTGAPTPPVPTGSTSQFAVPMPTGPGNGPVPVPSPGGRR